MRKQAFVAVIAFIAISFVGNKSDARPNALDLVRRSCDEAPYIGDHTWRSERCPLPVCRPDETALIRINEKKRAQAFIYDPVKKCRGTNKIQIPAMDDPRCMVPLFDGPRKARIVVHHTEGPRDEAVERLYAHHVLKLGYSDIGYHYFIALKNGSWRVYETRPLWAEGGHIRATANSGTIGVAIAGNYLLEGEGADGPPPGAVAQLLKLISHLKDVEKIEITGIASHDEVLLEHGFCAKGCPGPASANLVRELKKLFPPLK